MNTTPNGKERNVQPQPGKMIPFCFEQKQVRTLLVDGEPWFVASDVCRAIGISNTTQALRALDEDERSMFNIGRQGTANTVNESGLYTLILRSREATTAGTAQHRFRKWVTAEVLPIIRKQGRFVDDGKMLTLLGETIGTDAVHSLRNLVKGKVSVLPAAQRRQATAKIWSQTRAAFGVRSVADIPAAQLDSARNFIAAYALEGEWIGRQAEFTDADASDWQRVNILINSVTQCYLVLHETQLRHHLSALGCRAGMEIWSFLHDAMGACGSLNKNRARELDAGAASVGWVRRAA